MKLQLLLLGSMLWVSSTTSADDSTFACYDNKTRCESAVRELMVDPGKFWFGSSYSSSCPGGSSSSLVCENPDTERKSLLARLLNLTDSSTELYNASQAISVANVTYNTQAGSYTGCGHTYQVPAVTALLVDPLNITRVSTWSLANLPTVTWSPRLGSVAHTLVIWDPGNFYMHGLYINCNSSLASGQNVVPYLGPLNYNLRTNPYIFAVYEQNATLNLNEVSQFLKGKSFYRPTEIFDKFNVFKTKYPNHVSVLAVLPDANSAQKISEKFYMANNCPYLISQLDTFQSLIRVTNLSVSWSNPNSTASLLKSTPYLTSLAININVRFDIDDYSVESCCSKYSLPAGSAIVDPFKSTTIRPGNTQNTPLVQLSPIDLKNPTGILGNVYTLFFLDVADGLVPNAKDFTFVTHWLVTNIKNADVSTGDVVAPYLGPNPLNPNVARQYMFLLLRQPVEQLNNTIFSDICNGSTTACRISLKPVLQAWNLTEIVGMTWFFSEPDGFSRYRWYDVFKARTKDEICKDQPGYGNPCPPAPSSSCPSNNRRNSGQVSKAGTFPVVAIMFLFGIVRHYLTHH